MSTSEVTSEVACEALTININFVGYFVGYLRKSRSPLKVTYSVDNFVISYDYYL